MRYVAFYGPMHGLTPQEYREKWGLRSDCPLVSPNNSAERSKLAKRWDLGRQARIRLAAYDFATGRAAQFLNEYARANDPFSEIGTRSVSVEITSVVRASESSFQVKWRERVFERGSLAKEERWTAILTVVIRPPRDRESLRKNPLGLFVNAVDWARELDTAAPAPASSKESADEE